jgi:hypothetical protein
VRYILLEVLAPIIMSYFVNGNELIKFARDFVTNRINSLEKDVKYCLQEPYNSSTPIYAPFPAMIFCLSTIDLLGALNAGDARRKGNTVRNSKNYMQRFMNYTGEQSFLLIEIFRHKLIHPYSP